MRLNWSVSFPTKAKEIPVLTRVVVLASALVFAASGATAATLNVSGGRLLGASGVVVDGNLYDVDFIDGTCIALFDGCDASSDFTFITQATAILASQALIDQVFLDGAFAFDSSPSLTNGCTHLSSCMAATPWQPNGTSVDLVVGRNLVTSDVVQSLAYPSNIDSSITTDLVYAVWTPVPEPGTGVMVLGGLAAMGARRNRNPRPGVERRD